MTAYRSGSTAGNSSGSGDLTLNKPSGVVDGDILIVITYREASSWNLPAGWAWLGDEKANFDNNGFIRYAWKEAASEGSSWTFSTPGTTWRILTCAAFSGVTDSAPFFDTPVGNSADTTQVVGSSVTTSYANSYVLLGTGNYDGADINVASSGMTQGPELGGNEIFYVAQAGAGASGTKTLSVTSNSGVWASIMTALWPAGTGGGGTSTPMTLTGATTPTGTLARKVQKTIGPTAVNASADDASEAATVVSITANPLANCDTANVWNAWIFRGLTIPANSTILSAKMTVRMTSGTLDEPEVTIFGLDTAAPSAFTTGASDISNRTRTTASVAWSNANAGTGDVDTSDLSTIISELYASYGPYSGGVIGLAFRSTNNTATRDTSVTSYDGSTTLCARLTIRYEQTIQDGTSTPMTLTGASTPTGTVGKSTKSTKTGSSTPTGTLTRILTFLRTLTGSSTPTGTLAKQITHSLAGELTSSGTLSGYKATLKTLGGELTSSGTLAKAAQKLFAGAITSAGTLARSLQRTLAGTLTSSGTLSSVKSRVVTFTGALSSSGTVANVKSAARTLAGVLTSSGTLTRSLLRSFSGTLTSSGTLSSVKARVATFTGALTSSGTVTNIQNFVRAFTGSLSQDGTLTRALQRALTGTLTSSGTLSSLKARAATFMGDLTPSGTLSTQLIKIVVTIDQGGGGGGKSPDGYYVKPDETLILIMFASLRSHRV